MSTTSAVVLRRGEISNSTTPPRRGIPQDRRTPPALPPLLLKTRGLLHRFCLFLSLLPFFLVAAAATKTLPDRVDKSAAKTFCQGVSEGVWKSLQWTSKHDVFVTRCTDALAACNLSDAQKAVGSLNTSTLQTSTTRTPSSSDEEDSTTKTFLVMNVPSAQTSSAVVLSASHPESFLLFSSGAGTDDAGTTPVETPGTTTAALDSKLVTPALLKECENQKQGDEEQICSTSSLVAVIVAAVIVFGVVVLVLCMACCGPHGCGDEFSEAELE